MWNYIDQRVTDIASYILSTEQTVRSTAKHFGISKSTVHKDLSHRLPQINKALYLQVCAVLDKNKAERHIRGGNATKEKYMSLSKNKKT